jgi:hypothetical protein
MRSMATASECVLLALAGTGALAAPSPYLTVDHSTEVLIDKAGALALWEANLPAARLARLYPPRKWGFASQVDGGFTDARVCVITARGMLLPRSGKALVFTPLRSATAFATQAGATRQQCSDLAHAKLTEAIGAVTAPLLRQ